MRNPWQNVPLFDYEEHMKFPGVEQLQTLNHIVYEQLSDFDVGSVMILGIAGGNGLEHVNPGKIKKVIGIDVNDDYLAACHKRYSALCDCLQLLNIDVSEPEALLPYSELIIANMFLEYVDLQCFALKIADCLPMYLSCTYQQENTACNSFVSTSPYTDAFSEISALHRTVEAAGLTQEMSRIGMVLIKTKEYPLPNGKRFVRLDFAKEPERNDNS
ncbi:MAG: methyltransferase type 11 [Clostridiales bacterium]|nr:methyltransferase type 11 [Clostridiales bacterium]